MFSKLGTKIALRKAGLGNVSLPSMPALDSWGGGGNDSANTRSKEVNGTAQQQSEGNGFQNPFANVQWGKAFSSWQTPPPPTNPVRAVPAVGERAQTHPKLKVPPVDGRPCVVLFLRFCGCPFTEKIFLQMRSLANRHPTIHFIAVSHCTKEATNAWAKQLGGAWNIDIIIDEDREIYALYGLGISNWGHVLNPRNGYNQYMLGKKEGVWGQQVGEGGCRWQVGGAYAIDDRGVVKWGGPMKSVDDQIVFEDGVKALGFGSAIENRSGVF